MSDASTSKKECSESLLRCSNSNRQHSDRDRVAENVFKARLEPSGREFSLDPRDSVLNCALRQRILLQYGCRNGRCSSCKYFLIGGDVDFGKVSPYSLSENEKEEGWALLCQARALSDLTIRDQDIADRDDAPVLTPRDETA